MNRRLRYLSVIAILVPLAFGVGVATSRAGKPNEPSWVLHGPYSPALKPANFVPTISNRYFPLKPGTTYHYKGYKGAASQRDDMVVTHRKKQILGISCTVVRDTVFQGGKPIERTLDWYAQDKHGNVWYMGEAAFDLKNGRFVRAADSWKSGVNGAKPGIIIQGDPRPGNVYRQEYYPPDALDQARVLGRAAVQVPQGTYGRSLATIEWSPVEPQLEKKWYADGVGEIQEHVVAGGHEGFKLVSVTHRRSKA